MQTIYPINGKATPVTPGTTFEYEQLDMYGRPWGYLWEKYYEQNMERPEGEESSASSSRDLMTPIVADGGLGEVER